jgi:type VI secretion system protein VasJ
MVAAYLTNGLMRESGLAGLRDGFQICGDLVETYWDTFYPPISRMRGRRNSIQWLSDQTTKFLETTTFEPQAEDICESLRSNIKRLDSLLSAKDDESPPLFRLIQLVDSIPIVPKPVQETELPQIENVSPTSVNNELPAESITPTPAKSSNAEVLPEIATTEEALSALEACNKRLNEISSTLIEADVTNPLAYRLKRMAAWSAITEPPPANNRQTMIPSPMSQIRDMINTAQSSQSWNNLLQICENNICSSIFWLDLHRISEQALEKVSAASSPARAEIKSAIAQLVRTYPTLTTLTFSDGTPFADEATKNWIADLQGAPVDVATPIQANSSNINMALSQAYEQADKFISDGLWSKALDAIDTAIQHAPSAETRLKAQINICNILLKKQPAINVVPFAEPLLRSVAHHNLAEWNPTLATEALTAAYTAYAIQPSHASKAAEILSQIATLSGCAAYEASSLMN